MKKILSSLVFALAVHVVSAAEPPPPVADQTPAAPADPRASALAAKQLQGRLLRELADSVVQVETFFKVLPSGEMPEMSVQYKCPNCNSYHRRGVEELVKERRPMRQPGFVIAPDEVLVTDLYTMPEWVSRTEVVFRGKRYNATPTAFFPEHHSCLLKVEEPPADWKPLTFDRQANGKLYNFFVVNEEGVPLAGLVPDGGENIRRNLDTGVDYQVARPNTLLADAGGRVITLTMNDEIPLSADRLAPPAAWPRQTAKERQEQLAGLNQLIEANVFPVRIRLASENINTPQVMIMRRVDGKDKGEFDGLGFKLADGRLLVNLRLSPDQTARIERIMAFHGDRTVDCKFVGSLQEYGALVVAPEAALPGKGIRLYQDRLGALSGKMLDAAVIRNFDGKLQVRLQPTRLTGFEVGYDNMQIPRTVYSNSAHGFLFTPDRRLLLLPLIRRDKLERYSGDRAEPVTAARLATVLGSDRAFDPNNIPRGAEERNQMAWLGCDFQQLTPDLARANRAAVLTDDGKKGALVANVMPDSPAAKIGLKPGDILLYLRPASAQQRLEFNSYEFSRNEYMQNFPWEQYDRIPEQVFERIPTPWAPLENEFNNRLTKLGIGTRIAIGVIADGKLSERTLTLEKAPLHFGNAPRFSDKATGLAVVAPTLEVRHYFRMKPEEPGLLIAKVRPGSPASVAGLKPYEIIVSVDDQPVGTLAEFERLIKDKKSFNLAVRRLAVTRVVKFQLPDAAAPAGEKKGEASPAI